MRIWITFILINIIYLNHVSTAPVKRSKFGNIADQIINPRWTLKEPDSKKKDQNTDVDSNNKNDENDPSTSNDDTNHSNITNDDKDDFHNQNKSSGKKHYNNKKGKRNNIKPNGRSRWYKIVRMGDLVGNLPEYRNHEDEQKRILIWHDERKIVMNENVNTSSINNLNDNQLIRQKRDYNNKLEFQDNKLKAKNIKQHDLKENANKKDELKTEKNTNIQSQEFDTQNKNEKESPRDNNLPLIQNSDNPRTKSTDVPIYSTKKTTQNDKNLPKTDEIESLMNAMNSSLDNNSEEKNSNSIPTSLESLKGIPHDNGSKDDKEHGLLKKIKRPLNPTSKTPETSNSKNDEKLPGIFTPISGKTTDNIKNNEERSPDDKDIPFVPVTYC
ncbi:hybrid signal transduction histidine kinase M-like [Melanaphis sacchari]|uniref:hybrid signal transduction histidine kinase M-like n=1 Tax=Melanaphis sacchari TaxID=742174 RepID=UPI000DC13555|nr:hybrid signal transduction histidine kinase M-like [Melanaphis sacchari]